MQQQALALQAYGTEHNIRVLTTAQFNGGTGDLQVIGAIASGMFGASTYCIADYGAATLLLTLESAEIAQDPKEELTRIAQVYAKILGAGYEASGYEVCQRPILLHCLTHKGYAPTETPDTISVAVDGGPLSTSWAA